MLETTLNAYLEMVKENFLKNTSSEEEAPMPDTEQLEEAGIELKDKKEIHHAFTNRQHERRRLLTTLLEKDGWTWKDVYGS